MKQLAIIVILLLAIGCTPDGAINETQNMTTATNNTDLFGQDFENVETEDVTTGGAVGYLAKPEQPGMYPGVVMIHEWWGLNENIKEMARILANEGYVVFAIDLYNGEVAATADEARQLSSSVRANPDEAIAKMKAAVAYLKEEQNVERVGSLGWCFGGGQSLQLSLNEDLDATVIYYGNLVNDTAQLQSIDGPVLGIFGEEDTSIPVSSVNSFESALDEVDVENEIHIYPGVGHAFANPSGDNYAEEETEDAWEKTVAFLNEALKSETPAESPSEDNASLKTFTLQGANFTFIMDGQVNPDIVVNEGDRVRIEFETTDRFLHDWVVDEFNAATEQVRAGNVTSVEFVADRKGTFEYYCSVGQHREMGMVGNLIVQ